MINIFMINCACLIHGDAYKWEYVEKLNSMLSRNFSQPVSLHVFTEASRHVPDSMIKHSLTDWPGVHGARKAWWYKLQMFDPDNFAGQLLYFDLDVVISGNLDWITHLPPSYFWTIRDFKYLQRPTWQGINSSVMYWNTLKHSNVWNSFQKANLADTMIKYKGDQDFITAIINKRDLRFFDEQAVQSWRWQIHDGGQDLLTRKYQNPGGGAAVNPATSIVVFHGRPKPHEVLDPYIIRHWH
jgi:hypothetical protein